MDQNEDILAAHSCLVVRYGTCLLGDSVTWHCWLGPAWRGVSLLGLLRGESRFISISISKGEY